MEEVSVQPEKEAHDWLHLVDSNTRAGMDVQHNKALNRFVWLVASATFCLLLAGALVTSHDAGLAVPDWPLSYGSWMPPLVGNIVYEHGHRMVAGFVGLLTMTMVVWLHVAESRRWVRRLGLAALAVVILQALLGGLTVLFLLPRPVSIAHACLGQVFFCLVVSLVVFTGHEWQQETPRKPDSASLSLSYLAAATFVALFLQLLLGAALRHHALGVASHLVGAILVICLVGMSVKRVWRTYRGMPELAQPALALGGLLIVQLILGAGSYWARLANAESPQPLLSFVVLTTAHLATGALMLAASVVLALYAHRRLVPREKYGEAPVSQTTQVTA